MLNIIIKNNLLLNNTLELIIQIYFLNILLVSPLFSVINLNIK